MLDKFKQMLDQCYAVDKTILNGDQLDIWMSDSVAGKVLDASAKSRVLIFRGSKNEGECGHYIAKIDPYDWERYTK